MELFGFLGLSNATILVYAAALGVSVIVAAEVGRLLRPARRHLDVRVDRLEMRLAASGDYQSLLQSAESLLSDVAPLGVTPVTEMFEASNVKRSRFSAAAEPSDIAQRVVDDLQCCIEVAAAIARPIQNMNDNGAMEVKAQRRRVGQEAKRLSARLNTATWDRHGAKLLSDGMPSTSVTLLQGFFTQVHALKAVANEQGKGTSVDGLMTLLHLSAELLKSAEDNLEEFRRQAE